MPSWYFEKKEIKNSPSYMDGIDTTTEARYRREGARFIVDAGTKLGLRYETCATGVVYFHRFYMFHSFKDFPRYVTAACCLFLAGKVEETPKKCKDIVKISQHILNPRQFAVFGNDPKEEVMTLERILLQTIKFDLQTEHPYAFLLKFAKLVKADKEKTQKLVQMSWTFINDSLCTTLCLQWEPEIIAASLMYLGTRLNKLDITDWAGKVPGMKQKWWECLVEDLSVDLMEDVCHQVLDLYSPSNQPQADSGESPPPPPPGQPNSASRTPNSQSSDRKRSLQSTPSDPVTPGALSNKSRKVDTPQNNGTPQKNPDKGRNSSSRQPPHSQSGSEHSAIQTVQPISSLAGSNVHPDAYSGQMANSMSTSSVQTGTSQQYTGSTANYSQYNPYVSSSQYQSSFMSGEGAKDLQNIMGTQPPASAQAQQAPAQPQYTSYSQPPPAIPGVPPPPGAHQMGPQYGMQGQTYPPGYNPSQYPASGAMPGPPSQGQPQNFQQQNVASGQQHQFQGSSYPQQYQQYQQNYQQQGFDHQHSQSQHKYQGSAQSYGGPPPGPRPRTSHNTARQPHPRSGSGLAQVRITGR